MYSLELIKKAKEIEENRRKLEVIPAYEMENVFKYAEGLFDFAKFKEEDKVKMAATRKVDPIKEWGWTNIRHLLKKGSRATIKAVWYEDKKFRYLIEFEETSWIDDNGNIKPNSDNHKTQISISEKWLTKASKGKKCMS